MLTRHIAFITGIASVLLVSSSVLAQDPTDDTGGGPARNFGGQGQLVFLSENTLDINHASNDTTTVTFGPAADYFIAPNLSIGAMIVVGYTAADNTDEFRFGIGPRVGYNIPFTNMLGLWPKIGFSYSHSNLTVNITQNDIELERTVSNNTIALNLYVPVMLHPTVHFLVGLGPYLDADLSGDNRVTRFGVKLTIGGWLDL